MLHQTGHLVRGTLIAQLCRYPQKGNPILDLERMENKMSSQAFGLQRGQGTQKSPELSISQQPAVDCYAKIAAVLRPAVLGLLRR